MATFTMTLNDVISYGYDIGLQNDPQRGYPIFDEAYRPTLNQRIIDRYKFQEIGQETVEMFIFSLNRKLREVMPYYNQLYKSTLLTFSPLDSTDYTETISSNATRNATDNTTQNATNSAVTDSGARNVQQDFPQTALGGNTDYATSAADSTSKTNVSGTNTGTSANTSQATDAGTVLRHMVGRAGSPAQLLAEFRQTMLNVDLMVLSELAPCFMMLWDNGDSFAPNPYGPFGLGYTFGYLGGFWTW